MSDPNVKKIVDELLARGWPLARIEAALDEYEERAAIIEYDGKMSRCEAERLAAAAVLGAGL